MPSRCRLGRASTASAVTCGGPQWPPASMPSSFWTLLKAGFTTWRLRLLKYTPLMLTDANMNGSIMPNSGFWPMYKQILAASLTKENTMVLVDCCSDGGSGAVKGGGGDP